ncbi:MAG: hypothetical protein M3O82_10600 [Verrucomicrobiota bacterium]|nr:hypothetical protein [Verrucomicrobiota bacterium]
MISADKSPFYKFGPAQAAGPDSMLAKNDHVWMVRREFGFSRVETEDGQFGYVATEDLKIAPPPEPTPTPPPRQLAKRTRSRLPSDVSQPNDMPLPQDSPAPGFRY